MVSRGAQALPAAWDSVTVTTACSALPTVLQWTRRSWPLAVLYFHGNTCGNQGSDSHSAFHSSEGFSVPASRLPYQPETPRRQDPPYRTRPQPFQQALLGAEERQAIREAPRSHSHRDRRPDPPLAGRHDGVVRSSFAWACHPARLAYSARRRAISRCPARGRIWACEQAASVAIQNCGVSWSPGFSRICRLKAELQRGA